MQQFDGMTYRSRYWDDRRARNGFKEFLDSVHGLDLTLWEEKGFWDDDCYTPFSFFEGDRVVASGCLYTMEMVIEGRERRLGQFSGVGTLPGFRRRGLNRWLTEQALEWARPTHDGFFLFSSPMALPFYAKCGFMPIDQYAPTLAIEPPALRPGLLQLDMGNDGDLALIERLASDRSPVSDVLGVRNVKLLMYHCLYPLRDFVYYIPDLEVAVFFKIDRDRLTLFDVVGRNVPPFAELHPYLAGQPHREVEFRFLTDKMGLEPTGRRLLADCNAHVLPPLRLPEEPDTLFPYSCQA